MRIGHISLIAVLVVACISGARAEDDKRFDAVRTMAAQAPVLEVSAKAGQPKFQVIRLNSNSAEPEGERYGVIRVKLPSSGPMTLVWMFADVENIAEYELLPVKPGPPIRGNTRLIYPPIHDHDKEVEGEKHHDIVLPKPWDQLELHMLGVPAELLKAGEEYLIWFRFSDKQPADVLVAAVLLENTAQVDSAKLPAVFGLPEPEAE